MIWHIFKKDWKLLWPFVLIVAAIEFVDATIWLILGHFDEPLALVQNSGLLRWAVILGIAALIIMAVHQDVVPGDRQDWLVRPVRRRDLFLEKLLFLLVAVHGPLVLVDLAHGMALGFPLGGSLSLAVSHGVFLLLVFSLPMLGIAAMTSTIVEAVGVTLAIFLVFGISQIALETGVSVSHDSNLTWMDFAFWSVAALGAAAIVIPLQYFRRATGLARGVVLGAVLLIPLPAFFSWAPAFAFQTLLSPDPAAVKHVEVAFDPDVGRFVAAPGGQNRVNSVWLPLSVSGLAAESIVISDRANVRIIGRDGSILFRGQATGDPRVTGDPDGSFHVEDFPVRTIAGGEVRTHELITLPEKIFDLVRSRQVRMELDYSMTLLHMEASDAIAALNGDKRTAKIGWCKTKLDYNGNFIELGCINLDDGDPPSCSTLVLENTTTGQKNPISSRCFANYAPYTHYGFGEAIAPSTYRQVIRDPQGLAKYPVDGSQLANAQIFIKTYKPVAHFTRHLTIPEIRLGDWEAQTGQIVANTAPAP